MMLFCMGWITAMLLVAGLIRPGRTFLFPDLSQRSAAAFLSGNSAAQYKIAVLQEEPYLFTNGSGYIPELLYRLAEAYKSRHEDGDIFPYEIYPVSTWDQLQHKANSAHWQMAFGLVSPFLHRTDDVWKRWLISSPVVYTTLQLVAPSDLKKKHSSKLQHRQLATVRSSSHKGLSVATVLRDSPEESLLMRSPKYRDYIHKVKTIDEGLDFIQDHSDAVLLTDSGIASHVAEQEPYEFQTLCPRKISGAGALYYGFFGRDPWFIPLVNSLIKQLIANGDIQELNAKYFGAVKQCH